MPTPHSTSVQKPSKPTENFPLFAHASGQWAKKIRGRLVYFGVWDDPDAALRKYLAEKDALHSGRTPRVANEVTVKLIANEFHEAKDDKVATGELSPRTRSDYQLVADVMVARLGKHRLVDDLTPADFASLRNYMAKRYGPHMLAKSIQIVRMIFKHGFEIGLLAVPMRYGPGFKRPTKKTMRLHRAKQGVKLFSADEINRMIGAAGIQLRAMILLGINCGFGNSDCATLEYRHVDLDAAMIDYPRPKTGVNRRCPLWPETVDAIRAAIEARPTPKDAPADLVFVTKRGYSWGKDIADSPVTKETAKILKKLGINGRRNFYTLRHTFRTIADESKDQPAVDHIMGHESSHMSSVYRERISDERLRAVVEHVRGWLYAKEGGAK